jgi:hypothetical protein
MSYGRSQLVQRHIRRFRGGATPSFSQFFAICFASSIPPTSMEEWSKCITHLPFRSNVTGKVAACDDGIGLGSDDCWRSGSFPLRLFLERSQPMRRTKARMNLPLVLTKKVNIAEVEPIPLVAFQHFCRGVASSGFHMDTLMK